MQRQVRYVCRRNSVVVLCGLSTNSRHVYGRLRFVLYRRQGADRLSHHTSKLNRVSLMPITDKIPKHPFGKVGRAPNPFAHVMTTFSRYIRFVKFSHTSAVSTTIYSTLLHVLPAHHAAHGHNSPHFTTWLACERGKACAYHVKACVEQGSNAGA